MPDNEHPRAHTPLIERLKARRVRTWAIRIAAYGAAALVSAAGLVTCVVTPPDANSVNGIERTDVLSTEWSGLNQAVDITWDAHMIPSIHAQDDDDVPYAIGLVHAHLRMAQMELFRKVSQGRLSEMAGPLTKSVDVAIRAMDLDRAVPEMLVSIDPETRAWIDRYVEGINDYRATLTGKPADARTLNLDYDTPWTAADVLTFGRLASVDVNWGRVLTVLGLQGERGAEDFEQRLWSFGDAGVPSYGAEQRHELSVLSDIGRTGSNAFVVHGSRSASGGALIASDPHLGLPQPNIWCIVGYRSPLRAAVGLTIPSLPFVLVGRSETIAWTGTNMQSSSTVFYELPEGWEDTKLARPIRTERIGVRWWFDSDATFRESTLGPVITDAPLLSMFGDRDVAMRWRGHQLSDEPGAFFRASDATDWESFRSAFAEYAAGGQNILYGDSSGNIGQLMAVEAIAAAAAANRVGVVSAEDPAYAWTRGTLSTNLPYAFNPSEGFLVSANNVPTPMEPALVSQGNANDRVVRMQTLLQEDKRWTLDDLATIQRDTYSKVSHSVVQEIVTSIAGTELNRKDRAVIDALSAWNGRYDAASVGALAYQRVLDDLIDAIYESRYSDSIRSTLRRGPYVHAFVLEDVRTGEHTQAVKKALSAARRGVLRNETWGEVHRLSLQHPIGMIPVLGRGYRYANIEAFGSTTTINKSAHPVRSDRHNTDFGANARLLMDMGSLDNNRVLLLGGQDGMMGSDRMTDQAMLWNSGGMVPLPITEDAQRAQAVFSSRLSPRER